MRKHLFLIMLLPVLPVMAQMNNGNAQGMSAVAHKGTAVSPTLNWGTYFGGTDERATCMVYGDSGCVYIAGITTSLTGIATQGAYQAVFGGEDDVFLAKFDSNGNLRWATYYGGSGSDEAYGMAYDGSGNVYLTGFTSSTNGIATPGTHQGTNGGGLEDAFLAKFSASGKLVWGTYYGGAGTDVSHGVCIDKAGNIYITGHTYSADSIATAGAYKTTGGGVTYSDAFLAKFSGSGAVIWATYYGGDDDDEPASVASDDSGNVYIAGATGSDDSIATPGAYQDSMLSDDDDGFLVKFSGAGVLQWGTYFGAGGSNTLNGIACDKAGNIYITGSTYCTDSIATPGSYQSALVGPANAYLTKFNSSGAIEWGTYFGGGADGGNTVAIDSYGNVYITGATASSTGIATTGAYQVAYGGGVDVFMAEFNNTGMLAWASYYGGGAYDEAFGAACDGKGNLYIAGMSKSLSGIASYGAFDTLCRASTFGYDAFVARFGKAVPGHTGLVNTKQTAPTFVIYPNPANDRLFVSCEGASIPVKITIADMAGRTCITNLLPSSVRNTSISLMNLPNGIYTCTMQTADQGISRLFAVQK